MNISVELDVDFGRMLSAVGRSVEDGIGISVEAVKERAKALVDVPNPTGLTPSAEGEPPRKVTGELQRNIDGLVVTEGTTVRGFVIAAVPYARRLEFGFVGVDSIGRVYNQGPRPYMRPALDALKGDIVKNVAKG